MTRRELARCLARLCRATDGAKDWPRPEKALYSDVPTADPDRMLIEAMVGWGDFAPTAPKFQPEEKATRATLADWMHRLGLPADASLKDSGTRPVTRAEAAQALWRALRLSKEWVPGAGTWLQPHNDQDGDGREDLEDPLPLDRNNDNIPDRLQSPI